MDIIPSDVEVCNRRSWSLEVVRPLSRILNGLACRVRHALVRAHRCNRIGESRGRNCHDHNMDNIYDQDARQNAWCRHASAPCLARPVVGMQREIGRRVLRKTGESARDSTRTVKLAHSTRPRAKP